MYNSDTLKNTKGNPGAPQSSFILNPTSVDVAGSYRPSNSSIIFLFAENTTLSATNNSFFQGSFYSPEAMVNIATSGLSGLNVTDSAGGKMTENGKKQCFVLQRRSVLLSQTALVTPIQRSMYTLSLQPLL